MSKQRAFVKYTKQGRIIPGSLIVTTKGGYPKDGLYREVTTSLCCDTTSNYAPWSLVTGGVAGDGSVINEELDNNNRFTIIGPNDDQDTGWVYLKQFFPTGAIFDIDYNWTSFDEGTGVDRPVYWTSATEPIGIPGDTTAKVEDTPENGTWNITVPPGEWFAVGIYSTDSCCGRGFLEVDFDFTP
jgi:hypothetical protein